MGSRESRYSYVRALLLSWEQKNDDEPKIQEQLNLMRAQTTRLKRVFERLYNFEVEEWHIPRRGAYRELAHKLWDFEKTYNDPQHLLIVYCGGHGAIDEDRKAIWKCYNDEHSPEVDWSSLQAHFLSDDTTADVLMLIDCCRAGSAVRAPKTESIGNIVYVLAASGFDSDAPLDGPHTFTANLIAELVTERTYSRGEKVVSIAGNIYRRLCNLDLPDGRRTVSSVHYPLRDPYHIDRTICLMRQISQERHLARLWEKPVEEFQHTSESSTAPERTLNHSVNQQCRSNTTLAEQPPVAVDLIAVDAEPPLHETIESTASSPIAQVIQAPVFGTNNPFLPPDEDAAFLRSISYEYMSSRLESMPEGHVDTSTPVFNLESFRSWLNRESGIFWISGNPGSGKTTLMKLLFRHDKTMEALAVWAKPKNVDIVFFSCFGGGTHLQRSISGLLRSLLFQILEQRPSMIFELRRRVEPVRPQDVPLAWTDSLLQQALDWALDQYEETRRHLCIFLDGLDEFADEEVEVSRLLELWVRNPAVKACVASRPLNVFVSHFGHCPALAVEDLTRQDILHYAREQLYGIQGILSAYTGEQLDELANKIAARSNGVFFWVHMVLRSIREGIVCHDEVETLHSRIDGLPSELEAFYENMLKSMDPVRRRQASKILQIVRAAHFEVAGTLSGTTFEPVLTTLGLHFAMRRDLHHVMDDQIRALSRSDVRQIDHQASEALQDCTGGLLEMGLPSHKSAESGRRISYYHQSVRDFLETPSVSNQLRKLTANDDFDANLCLVGSSVIQLKKLDFGVRGGPLEGTAHQLACWTLVEQAMACAARVEGHTALLIEYLDELDKTMKVQIDLWHGQSLPVHWSGLLSFGHPNEELSHCNLLSLAVTYSIIPYIEMKIVERPTIVTEHEGRPLLDFALLSSAALPHSSGLIEPRVVEFLLKHGALPNELFSGRSVWARFLHVYNRAYFSPTRISSKMERLRRAHDLLVDYGANKAVAYRMAFRFANASARGP
ncbi:hypothetical protein LTR37_019708 [Vermiconidia calcicola]|uniref:Uncharacterized protein n=1 Tax=Vermiconidia calcicola TaxID=1690605 RepID=A0ACC3MEU9_9PEZI|nr:hypothetical protein LTR37_019708 [Vermiconidia calcicola]